MLQCLPDTETFAAREVCILSDIIQAAYTDTLSTETWTKILDMIGQVVPYDAAGAVFANVQTGRLENRILRDVDADLNRWYAEHYPGISMIAETAQTRGLTVWRPTEVLGKQEYEASEIHQDLVNVFGLGEPLCITCGSLPHITARGFFLREIGKVDYTDRDCHILMLLQPHFSSALGIAKALLQGDIYQEAFEQAARPVLICGSTGKIMEMNARAREVLRDGAGNHTVAATRVEAIVSDMIAKAAGLEVAEVVGRKCYFSIVPSVSPDVPIAYIVRIDSSDHLKHLLSVSMMSCGLSERESEICMMIVQGMSNREIAEKVFIAECTVKDHVSSIFEKLAVSSRSAVVPSLLGY